MGLNCTCQAKKDFAVYDTEKHFGAAAPIEKLQQIINIYACENEKMKKELESIRIKDEDNESKTRSVESDEVMNELSAMKAMMEQKDRILVKHRLWAALQSKANSLVTSETVTKLLRSGSIEKFDNVVNSKSSEKWVEIHVHKAQTTPEGVKKGFLMLTCADQEGSQLLTRCQIVQVKHENANVGAWLKSRSFALIVISSGAEKELTFACDDEKTREEWVHACNDGFSMVDEEFRTLKIVESDWVVIDIVFTKPKLGITVEEKILETGSATDEKLVKFKGVKPEPPKIEKLVRFKGVKPEPPKIEDSKDNASVSMCRPEKPCELTVQVISDDSLLAAGLTPGCVVKAINGMNLRGLMYNKQIGMLTNTKKPFTITFLKKTFVERIAFPSILKKLVADEENSVKSTFYELVCGTQFGIELNKSKNKTAVISELLSNQQRLRAVLKSILILENEL